MTLSVIRLTGAACSRRRRAGRTLLAVRVCGCVAGWTCGAASSASAAGSGATSSTAALPFVRAVDPRLLVLPAPRLRVAAFLTSGSGSSVSGVPASASARSAFTAEVSAEGAGTAALPPDRPPPPRLRRRRGLVAGRTSPSSGPSTSAGSGSLGATASCESASTEAFTAERAGRPPRDRLLRCPPVDRVRVTAPSPDWSAEAFRAGEDFTSGSSPAASAPAGPPSPASPTPPDPADLVWGALCPDRRLRRRRAPVRPGEDSPPSEEIAVGSSSRSASGAVVSFICSLNARPFVLQDRAQARASAAQRPG
jgi:hypothetical protein